MVRQPEGNPGRPSRPLLKAHERALEALERRGRLRRLSARSGLDFTSNDYLGLADSAALREAAAEGLTRGVPLGAGGSRLLRGNHPEHEALEAEAARFFGAEAALYFGGGFPANAALIATLPAHGDLIVHDALIHASAWDGMTQTKAETVLARHNDPDAFAGAIAAWRARGGKGRVWIAVESLYSMDGDVAPLAELAALADRHDAMLLIDEAHATGVHGPGGRGLGAVLEGRDNVVALHTCGKALGASGALVTCAAPVRDFLVNRARGFIYATAPSPLMAAVVRRSLQVVQEAPQLREQLLARISFASAQLTQTCGIEASGSQIIPVIVGSDTRAVAAAEALQRAGFDVRAIRPPTVPEGTARLRITLTLNTSEEQTRALFTALADVLAALPEAAGARTQAAAMAQPRPASAPAGLRAANVRRAVPRFVVTGTGTGVGKTVFAAALTAALDGDYWKPVQAGLDEATDSQHVRVLAGLAPSRIHREAYRLAAPASPHLAAELDGIAIEPERLVPPATERALVIEGAGGVLVPLTREVLFADVFARWEFPVILVASTALGTINHTLLSLEALRARGVPVHGVAFTGDANEATETIIAERGQVRRLGRLAWVTELTQQALADAFSAGFSVEDFRS